MNYASVYRINSELVFCSNAQTIDQLSLAAPPYLYLSIDSDAVEIFAALKLVLDANKNGVPHPKQSDWPLLSKKHLQGLKLSSMSSMYRKATLCSIAKSATELIFTPTYKEGNKGGFLHCVERNIIISADSPAGIVAQSINDALILSAGSV